ncbi:MAG: hypothetical protein BWK80_26055 [Desulfobacteraceae bacterium IS3]|nr:MAG: hypothetical protein BWK80_26055 [Desulfobacteraceae bacterium IS3]HAO22209.1 hypothetical protein [Desulfobacteraceae bacterium]
MKKRMLILIFVLMTMIASYPAHSCPGCIAVETDLKLSICAEYKGVPYSFGMNYAPDSGGFYWKADIASFRQIESAAENCIHVEDDFALKICCAAYQGVNYTFTLNYSPRADGHYWKADTSTFSRTLNRPSTPQIGANFIRFYWSEPPADGLNKTEPYYQPDEIFRRFADLGIQTFRQFVKADLLWNVVEPKDNQWNWEAADSVLPNPNYEPIVTLMAMQYSSATPPWAVKTDKFQKHVGTEARDYITTVVRRYAPYIKYWELGNEMDHWRVLDESTIPASADKLPASLPSDGFSPQEQGVFLAEVAAIIRQNDPDAVIVLPGMGGLDDYLTETWLPGVIEGGGKDWFDIVNYHYYPGWEQYTILRPKFQAALERLGIANKPIWMTETGTTSDPTLTLRTNYPNSPQEQAADVFRRIIQAYGFGDSMAIWHCYLSSEGFESTWREYGLISAQGEIKPSYYAFRLLTQEMLPFKQIERLSSDARGINAYRITTAAGQVRYVVWGKGSYTIPTGITQRVSVVPNADGAYTWQSARSGEVLALTTTPVVLK